jgi:hypothetical protein
VSCHRMGNLSALLIAKCGSSSSWSHFSYMAKINRLGFRSYIFKEYPCLHFPGADRTGGRPRHAGRPLAVMPRIGEQYSGQLGNVLHCVARVASGMNLCAASAPVALLQLPARDSLMVNPSSHADRCANPIPVAGWHVADRR